MLLSFLFFTLIYCNNAFINQNKYILPNIYREKSLTILSDFKNNIYIDNFLLNSINTKPGLSDIIFSLFNACKQISYKIKTASCTKTACYNQFGDEQLAIDILANNIIMYNLQKCKNVNTISSEEETNEMKINDNIDGYSVSFDPLDGSSIIDSNLAVGTIFGVWKGNELTNIYGRDLEFSGMCQYGPRTTLTFSLKDYDGVFEFLLLPNGKWINSNFYYNMLYNAKIYSPGNIRAINDNQGYRSLYNYWIENNYQLRYSGGMVPDVNQLLVKGNGIFVNIQSKKINPKLRMLYEIAPLGFLIEKAGGKTSDGTQSVLDILISNTNQTSQMAFGSINDIELFDNIVGKLYI